jgi:hypothetical protein
MGTSYVPKRGFYGYNGESRECIENAEDGGEFLVSHFLFFIPIPSFFPFPLRCSRIAPFLLTVAGILLRCHCSDPE